MARRNKWDLYLAFVKSTVRSVGRAIRISHIINEKSSMKACLFRPFNSGRKARELHWSKPGKWRGRERVKEYGVDASMNENSRTFSRVANFDPPYVARRRRNTQSWHHRSCQISWKFARWVFLAVKGKRARLAHPLSRAPSSHTTDTEPRTPTFAFPYERSKFKKFTTKLQKSIPNWVETRLCILNFLRSSENFPPSGLLFGKFSASTYKWCCTVWILNLFPRAFPVNVFDIRRWDYYVVLKTVNRRLWSDLTVDSRRQRKLLTIYNISNYV